MPPTTVPELTTHDLERSLRDALVRQFEKRGPTGQVVTEAPVLEEVFPDTKELIYRDAGKFWRAPYLLNGDRTAGIGVGVPVAKTWTMLSAVQQRDLERALKEGIDPDAKLIELRAKSAIVNLSGAYCEVPFLFDGPTCWVGSPRPMERDGSTFSAPKNMVGVELDAYAKVLQASMRQQGFEVPLGACQITAAKVLAVPAPTKVELGRFLTELFNASKRRQ